MSATVEKVLVLGASGMLGRQVMAELQRRGVGHSGFTHADLDIGDESALRAAVAETRPAFIINCAAYTKVDDAEANADLAMQINGHAPGVMAQAARQIGATLVHVSSDYVFPGQSDRPYREDDPTAPPESLGAYARSKLEGDRQILDSGCRHLVARTSWVFGPGGPNFVDTIANAAAARPQLKVVNDQRGRPTYTVDLAAGIFALLDRGATGVVNVTNSDECTWYEFAREIVRAVGLSTPVHPCTTAEFLRPARRPAYSVLDLARYTAIVGRPLRSWRDALAAYLAARG